MNCSVYEYLTNYRINKAKELLLINSRRKVQDLSLIHISVGNDWEQESVTRPEGYPLYHYLQTKEGVGEVTVYSRNQAVSDNILSNSHTIELQKGQGILIAPDVYKRQAHNRQIRS